MKEREQRKDNHIPADVPILFPEVDVDDPSEFEDVLEVRGVEVGGHWVLRAQSSTVPNAIAAFLLHLRDTTDKEPHCYFGWTQGNPIAYLFSYLLFGEGDTAPVTHEVLRSSQIPNGVRSSTSAVDRPFQCTIRAIQKSARLIWQHRKELLNSLLQVTTTPRKPFMRWVLGPLG